MSELDKNGVVEFKINAVGSPVRGSEMFAKMMSHYGENVKGIRGIWVSKDISITNKNLGKINELTAKGIPLEEAVKSAWTAKQAKKYGFTQRHIEKYLGTPGNYTIVQTRFTKK